MEQLATGFLPNKAVEKTDKDQVFMNKKMKAAQDRKPGGDWELVERDIPEPANGQVRVKVEACGICHSDTLVKEGLWPGLQYPRVPGHEIAGRIDAIGADVTQWKEGDRVGVGWHGGHDLVCNRCRRGDFAMCVNRKVTGIDFDGGYTGYITAPASTPSAILYSENPPSKSMPVTLRLTHIAKSPRRHCSHTKSCPPCQPTPTR